MGCEPADVRDRHRQILRRPRRGTFNDFAVANMEAPMTDKPTTPQLEIVSPSPTPNDALDIEGLWLDPALGDGLTDTNWHTIPVDKPKDFFRVHPDPDYRRRTEIYAHKTEGQIETTYYILGPEMRGRLQEARPCVLVTCIYRDGSPRLWPIMFPREGEKDNTAWSSARSAARTAIDKWAKLVWAGRSYLTRDAAGIRTRPGLEEIAGVQQASESRIRAARRDPRHRAPDLSRVDGSASHD